MGTYNTYFLASPGAGCVENCKNKAQPAFLRRADRGEFNAMARPKPLPDNRFVNCSSDFDLMAETSPQVLERWATLHLPDQDQHVRDELRRALDVQSVRKAA